MALGWSMSMSFSWPIAPACLFLCDSLWQTCTLGLTHVSLLMAVAIVLRPLVGAKRLRTRLFRLLEIGSLICCSDLYAHGPFRQLWPVVWVRVRWKVFIQNGQWLDKVCIDQENVADDLRCL